MNEIFDALLRGEPRFIGLAIVLGSMLLYVAGANAAWDFSRMRKERGWTTVLYRFGTFGGTLALYEILRLAYYLGIPYAAIYFGLIDFPSTGLAVQNWEEPLRWTFIILLTAWAILMIVWVPYLRASASTPLPSGSDAPSWPRRIVNVIYLQVHWAFYRSALIYLLTIRFNPDDAVYWGTTLGLVLVVAEGWLCGRVRADMTRIGKAEVVLWDAAQAFVNAVGFLITRNVWVLALVHLVLEFAVPHLQQLPKPVNTQASAALATGVDVSKS